MTEPRAFDPGQPFVVYVGPFSFPEGGAAARRILGNAQSLAKAGYQVLVLSGQQAADDSIRRIADGVYLASTSERNAEHLPNLLRLARYVTMGSKSREWLDRLPGRPSAVILYSGYTPYILQLRDWCRRAGVPLIFDAVEWYTAASPIGFAASPYLWQTEIAMRFLIPRLDGAIAISRWLEDYYVRTGLPVVRVPPTLDVDATPVGQGGDGERLGLVYAGSPGRKDLLGVLLRAVTAVDPAGERLRLDIYGPGPRDLDVYGVPDLPTSVTAHGSVPQREAMAGVAAADFSVLLRRPDKVATAGFPTKFVESLAVGTPVIATLTSDLADHLVDGRNGLICDDASPETVARVLERALTLTGPQQAAMRAAARHTAETGFDYRRHTDGLRRLVGSVTCAKDASTKRTGT
ncbi:glycosyltransferase [Brevundimonas sp. A19_0]|uniref:glycosyltransferase n=1 Tax=Brevundimonas sp. A19_0 TaxID=2821087 RepID=UPI001ADCE367|nr:glycosyltransferase [Brevundimonas sp. A19_0]MBO9500297.1 glycosyltransferase [Brevundimonas sp. A19_0]